MPADHGSPVSRPGLTDQQRRAITARDVSVALSAGAGCGKTFVLTERFLAELEPDGAQARSRLGQLVAITFTERAAREMRDRIRLACHRRLLECDEAHVDYWQNLIRELDSARVSTIHSFCGSLLRSHAVEAGLDPRFRVLDGSQSATLMFELIDDEVRSRLADRDELTLSLLVRFNLERLHGMVSGLVAARQEIDWAQWQAETPEGLVERWQGFWRSDTVPRLLRRIAESPAAKTVLDLAMRYPPAHPKMRERCDLLLEQLPRLPTCADPAAQLVILRDAAKVQGGGTKKDWVSEEIFTRFKDAAAALRKDIDAFKDRLRFDPEAARPVAETALQVLSLAAAVDVKYEARKQELGVLDFNDLLIHARDLLTSPQRRDLRRRMAAQIRLLLVDEFQDTDPLQVGLVKALCNDEYLRGKLFFVGDFKQSIYRFRGADPQVFRQLREEIPTEGRLPLSLNFRSQPAVLDFVNALFCDALGPGYEPLSPHRGQVSPTPAVEFLWACEETHEPATGDAAANAVEAGDPATTPAATAPPASESDDAMGAAERLRRREADWIARRIRAMLDAGEAIVWDSDAAKQGRPTARAVRQGDIALLFRALTNVEYYEEALQRYGIEYYLVGGHAYYAQQEVFDVLNLLRALESPSDAVSLIGVLRSPMFSLLDETFLWLSLHADGVPGGLFDRAAWEQLDGEQRHRVEFAAATLGDLRAVKDRMPIAQLIHEALRRTGYDAILLSEFLGERKLANLQKLIEQARAFDAAGMFRLADFITQLSEFVARQPDEPLAATHPESHNVVKLMTIHQSKGLEFPVTIVPNVAWPRRVIGPSVAFTPQLGPMLKEPNVTTGYDLYMLADSDEDLAESQRLLYVAATRAADYLILSAGVENPLHDAGDEQGAEPAEGVSPFKPSGPWTDLLAQRFDLLSGEVNGRLPKGSGKPDVRVTMTRPAIHSKPLDLRRRRDLKKIVEKARQMAAEGSGKSSRYLASIEHDPAARRQYSFSRLTGKLHARALPAEAESIEVEAPAERLLDPRGLGTLVHAVLAEIDFSKIAKKAVGASGTPGVMGDAANDIDALVRRHALQHLPDAKQGDLDEPMELVRRFLASPRAAEMAAARDLHAELEFLLAWPSESSAAAGRYLQGFIDCLYCDGDGRWHLIDYKTNRVASERIGQLAAEYEMQMLVYALAAERILKRPPAEVVLHFLRPGLEYAFTWNDAARRRAVDLLEQAMAQ